MPLRDWQSALDYLYGLTNWETRPPGTRPSFELDRIRALLAALGHPERRWPALHVGGTNGKGSTCAMLASVLRAAGYRVGLFSSPHLHTVRERIQVDGEPIAEAEVLAWLDRHRPILDAQPGLTTFEALTALAFDHFAARAVDLAVIEVGLGGRLDTTNVLQPAVTVLTPIGLDHVKVLGDRVALIAADKAGIFKPGVPAVSAPQLDEAAAVIAAEAAAVGAPLYLVGRDLGFGVEAASWRGQRIRMAPRTGALGGRPFRVDIALPGPHQAVNAATAVAALAVLTAAPRDAGDAGKAAWRIDRDAIRRGLAQARWPGRFECFETGRAVVAPPLPDPIAAPGDPAGPLLVVDGAHNPPAAEALRAALDACFGAAPRQLILGFSLDKDIPAILPRLLAGATSVVATGARHPRAMPAAEVADAVATLGLPVTVAPDAESALDLALDRADAGAVVVATGSIFLAAEVRLAWLRRAGLPLPPCDPPLPRPAGGAG